MPQAQRDPYDYTSPFSRRYGSNPMRRIWSDHYRRETWRRLWVALAETERVAGLVTQDEVDDLRTHERDVDVKRANQIEAECGHEVVAELKAFAEQCPRGGRILHLGATSADIEDNANALRVHEALGLTLARVEDVLLDLADRIDESADVATMGFTHLQPAEPTTVGYRLAQYGQDLLRDLEDLRHVRRRCRGKGLKGAVGTSASFEELLKRQDGTDRQAAPRLEDAFMRKAAISAHAVTTQSYPRKQDWLVVNALAGVAASIHRFALDLRLLQSPGFGEWREPAHAQQIGSSAMPFKRNPSSAETINSLARLVATLPRVAWDNAAHSMLERTLDDSANMREVLPTAFLAVDDILLRGRRIIRGLEVDIAAVQKNLRRHSVFAGLERILLACCRQGGDRQLLHHELHLHVWETQGDPNRDAALRNRLVSDQAFTRFLSVENIDECLDVASYVGDAQKRARGLASAIRQACA